MGYSKKINLFRFEKIEDKRIETIRSKKLWFSSPNKFNDLNDCHLHLEQIKDDIFTDVDLFEAAEKLYDNVNNPSDYPLLPLASLLLLREKKFRKLDGENFIEKMLDAIYQGAQVLIPSAIEEGFRQEIKKSTGVCCFFGITPDNQLMWAHYADNHHGFCTEYSVKIPDDLPSIGPYSVSYTSDWPLRVYDKELIFSPASTLKRVVTTKGIDWAHEREYRFLEFGMINHADGEVGKSVDLPFGLSPCRIIAGERVNEENLDKLKKLADDLGLEFSHMTRKSFS